MILAHTSKLRWLQPHEDARYVSSLKEQAHTRLPWSATSLRALVLQGYTCYSSASRHAGLTESEASREGAVC